MRPARDNSRSLFDLNTAILNNLASIPTHSKSTEKVSSDQEPWRRWGFRLSIWIFAQPSLCWLFVIRVSEAMAILSEDPPSPFSHDGTVAADPHRAVQGSTSVLLTIETSFSRIARFPSSILIFPSVAHSCCLSGKWVQIHRSSSNKLINQIAI